MVDIGGIFLLSIDEFQPIKFSTCPKRKKPVKVQSFLKHMYWCRWLSPQKVVYTDLFLLWSTLEKLVVGIILFTEVWELIHIKKFLMSNLSLLPWVGFVFQILKCIGSQKKMFLMQRLACSSMRKLTKAEKLHTISICCETFILYQKGQVLLLW